MKEHVKLGQALLIILLTTFMLAVMIVETAALWAGAGLVLLGIACVMAYLGYLVSHHGHAQFEQQPQVVRVIAREPEKPNLRKAA